MKLLGDVPTEVLVRKARALFPALVDDPEQRANFREQLRCVALCRRYGAPTDRREAEEIANGVNALREASYHITVDDTVVGSHGPMSGLPPKTTEDVLSEAAVDLKAADAADALAAAFEEDQP